MLYMPLLLWQQQQQEQQQQKAHIDDCLKYYLFTPFWICG
jgi:hypothetical protein